MPRASLPFGLATTNRAEDDVDVVSRSNDTPADHLADRPHVIEIGRKSIEQRADQAEGAGQQGAEPKQAHPSDNVFDERLRRPAGRRKRMRREQNREYENRKGDRARPMPGDPTQSPIPNRLALNRRTDAFSLEVGLVHENFKIAYEAILPSAGDCSGASLFFHNHKAINLRSRFWTCWQFCRRREARQRLRRLGYDAALRLTYGPRAKTYRGRHRAGMTSIE